MKLAALAFLGLLAFVARAAEPDPRFSQTLSAAERTQIGLEKLSSDQVAVLDAIVRRDMEAKRAGRAENSPAAFSLRLTEDEKRNTGLAAMTAVQVATVDSLVERHEAARLARALLSPPVYIARHSELDPNRTKSAEREIHGEFSLSMGWGSGGYSEQTGSMVLRMDDPEHRYSISVGYSESRIKGPAGGYIVGPPYYSP